MKAAERWALKTGWVQIQRFIASSMMALVVACQGPPDGLASSQSREHDTPRQPNFIVILADDLRADSVGYAGHPIINTPNIDRLAQEGVQFSNAFATSPICTPSRTSLLTGHYERKHGVNFQSGTVLSANALNQTYPALLQAAGYHVGYLGKNHTPVGQSQAGSGYDSGVFEQAFNAWFGNHRHTGFYPKTRHPIYEAADADTQIEILDEATQAFLTLDRTESPVAAKVGSKPENQPFALLINFNLPHGASTSTMQLRPSDDDLYRTVYRDRLGEFPLPETYLAADEIETPKLPPTVYNGEFIEQYDYVKTPDQLRERMTRMAQTITGIDRMVGNILATLERTGQSEDTIIIFTSDHGIHLGEHGLGGKALLYEQSIRIPLLIVVPDKFEDSYAEPIEELVALIDIAPTILDFAGIRPPADLQGESVRDLMAGRSPTWRQRIFLENLYVGQNYPRIEGTRGARYKYIRYFDKAEEIDYANSLTASFEGEDPIYEEFFDLETDPLEQFNLIDSHEHAALIETYRLMNTDLLTDALQ